MTKIVQVDAFTNKPFTGNPAAVCVLDQDLDRQWMQQVAEEMNLSETAFLLKQESNTYSLRWFTPTVEVNLCGHATLASAHVLWEQGHLDPDKTALFETRSGLLTARKCDDWIELDFPIDRSKVCEIPKNLETALDTSIRNVEKTTHGHLIVEVESENVVHRLNPNFTLLNNIETKLIIVTSLASPENEYDFVSRVFAPRLGILEDPVTGSAHCSLAPYWGVRTKRNNLVAYQASKRGGLLKTEVTSNERVLLSGQAVTVFEGNILFEGAVNKPTAVYSL